MKGTKSKTTTVNGSSQSWASCSLTLEKHITAILPSILLYCYLILFIPYQLPASSPSLTHSPPTNPLFPSFSTVLPSLSIPQVHHTEPHCVSASNLSPCAATEPTLGDHKALHRLFTHIHPQTHTFPPFCLPVFSLISLSSITRVFIPPSVPLSSDHTSTAFGNCPPSTFHPILIEKSVFIDKQSCSKRLLRRPRFQSKAADLEEE